MICEFSSLDVGRWTLGSLPVYGVAPNPFGVGRWRLGVRHSLVWASSAERRLFNFDS
ncbi:MAG: hypothetical protein QOI34_926 [Verrucomicrobiota bacterium]|jgi:hypothetical protein